MKTTAEDYYEAIKHVGAGTLYYQQVQLTGQA